MGKGVLTAVLAVMALGCGTTPADRGFTQPGGDAGADVTVDTGGGSGTDTGAAQDAQRCARQSDCDDQIACTDDSCVVGGVCQHDPVDARCATGQRCFVGRGCAAGLSCVSSADCDDHVDCTQDICVAGGTCQHVRNDSRCQDMQVCSVTLGCVARGRCGTDPDCDDGRFCNGMERCAAGGTCQAGTAPDCSTGDPCIAGSCDDSTQMCIRRPITPCGGSVTAGTYTLDMPPTYSCGAGALGPIGMIRLGVSSSGVEVDGFPVPLRGASPMGGMFSAMGTENRGGCTWRYTLSGEFRMAGRFDGTWNVTFDTCVITMGCVTTSGFFTGTMH